MKTTNPYRTLCFALALLAVAVVNEAQAFGVAVGVSFAPPPLPVYVQPPLPGPGYVWTPGYWAYDDVYGYYWVPGTWVLAPTPGLLWTPGYWAFGDGLYVWNPGYWGPTVGFYGGIDYGFGYFGVGFAGGYWHDREFFYNRAVTRIDNGSIRNVYDRPIANHYQEARRASYNGPGGAQARPSAAELAAARAPHHGLTSEQQRHQSAARTLPALRALANHGRPPIAATTRPGVFAGREAIARRGAIATPRAVARAPAREANAAARRQPAENRAFGSPYSARGAYSRPYQERQPAAHGAPSARPAPAGYAARQAVPARRAPANYFAQHAAPGPSYGGREAPARGGVQPHPGGGGPERERGRG